MSLGRARRWLMSFGLMNVEMSELSTQSPLGADEGCCRRCRYHPAHASGSPGRADSSGITRCSPGRAPVRPRPPLS
jgi:hypothetical protein